MLEKLAGDVEPEVPVIVVARAARDLAERRAEAVRKVDLEDVAAGAPLDREAHLADTRIVPGESRRDLANQIQRWAHPQARAEADHRGAAVAEIERARVDHDHRLRVQRGELVKVARHEHAERSLLMLGEIVLSLERRQNVEAD